MIRESTCTRKESVLYTGAFKSDDHTCGVSIDEELARAGYNQHALGELDADVRSDDELTRSHEPEDDLRTDREKMSWEEIESEFNDRGVDELTHLSEKGESDV